MKLLLETCRSKITRLFPIGENKIKIFADRAKELGRLNLLIFINSNQV